jgi:hypothetical protein
VDSVAASVTSAVAAAVGCVVSAPEVSVASVASIVAAVVGCRVPAPGVSIASVVSGMGVDIPGSVPNGSPVRPGTSVPVAPPQPARIKANTNHIDTIIVRFFIFSPPEVLYSSLSQSIGYIRAESAMHYLRPIYKSAG